MRHLNRCLLFPMLLAAADALAGTDAFPVECVMPPDFVQVAGTSGWSVANDQIVEGACSLKSLPVSGAGAAQVEFTGYFADGNVTFRRQVNGAPGYAFFVFYIDGVQQGSTCDMRGGAPGCNGDQVTGATASGFTTWFQPAQMLSFPIAAGVHTLRFSYEKVPGAAVVGSDAAWIDALTLPLAAATSVASRKTHGHAGAFDIPLDTTAAVNEAVSVESRHGAPGHAIVFHFNVPVATVGKAYVLDATRGAVRPVATTISGRDVTAALDAIADGTRATIVLQGVNGAVNASASAAFVMGDANATGTVNSSDILAVKAHSGQAASVANFRLDVDASGGIDSSDVADVRAQSGTSLATQVACMIVDSSDYPAWRPGESSTLAPIFGAPAGTTVAYRFAKKKLTNAAGDNLGRVTLYEATPWADMQIASQPCYINPASPSTSDPASFLDCKRSGAGDRFSPGIDYAGPNGVDYSMYGYCRLPPPDDAGFYYVNVRNANAAAYFLFYAPR